MGDAGDAIGNRRAMEEASIGEEDAEGFFAFDHEMIGLARLRMRMSQGKQTRFLEAQRLAIEGEPRRPLQASDVLRSEVPDTADEGPVAG